MAICSQWDASNIEGFVEQARSLGFVIGDDNGANTSAEPIATASKTKRRVKYIFDGESLAASHLVLKVIKHYVDNQEFDINLYQLNQAFPNELQGPIGVANKYDDVIQKYGEQVNNFHFAKDKYMLDLQDGKVAVSTEWRDANIGGFIDQARKLGYAIEEDSASLVA